ncbi:MAG TPA: hypothetical protein VHK04_09365, partial [Castellaniella sp.]|nr:hypothetical protein [Castellaniella sp.]
SVMTGTAIVGPMLSSSLFALDISPEAPLVLPGAPFFMGAMLCLTALLLAGRQLLPVRSNVQPAADSALAPA